VLDEGSAAEFESTGLTTSVENNSATTFRATATDEAGNTSPCSEGLEYVEDSTALTGPLPELPPGPTGNPNENQPPEPSTATAAGIAMVKGRIAFLRLRCNSGRGCRGTVRLVARLRASRHPKASRRSRKRARNLTIGKRRFTIAANRTKMIRVRLTHNGKRLVRRTGRRGLRVRLRGTHVKRRVVTLRRATNRRTQRARRHTPRR